MLNLMVSKVTTRI